MEIDSKYRCTNTFHRTLPQTVSDPNNSIVSCGFLTQTKQVYRNICFSHYGGLYVLSGTAVYEDAVTGERFPVKPGCVVQRMPGRPHHFYIDNPSDWLEFYFCAGAEIFETLVQMKLVSDAPVFYVSENAAIFNRLLNYHTLFAHTENSDAPTLFFEFQKLLYFLNTYQSQQQQPWLQKVIAQMQQDLRVGTPLEEFAQNCGMGYEMLRKQFKQALGCSLSQYRIQLRINAAKSMLLDQGLTIQQTAAALGYCDSYAFCKQFKQQVGISPGRFLANQGYRTAFTE